MQEHSTRRRPDPDLSDLVEAIDGVLDRPTDETPAAGIASALHDWIERSPALPGIAVRADAERYEQTILHCDPLRGYSIAAFVWPPGQGTAIHDHRAWCVTGLVVGSETEERFELRTSPEGETLTTSAVVDHSAGAVCILEPPHDLHRMQNRSDELSISVHVYGIDLEAETTSIAHTYEQIS